MGISISSELPQEITFGIMTEIMLVKNKGSLNHRKEIKKVKIYNGYSWNNNCQR